MLRSPKKKVGRKGERVDLLVAAMRSCSQTAQLHTQECARVGTFGKKLVDPP